MLIRRLGREKAALVSAEELAGLQETAHLLRSPRNARRLLSALRRAVKRTLKPRTLAETRRDLGLDASR